EIYYVKQHFDPSFLPGRSSRKFLVHETFFSYGPIEKIVSLLGIGRVNVVAVKLDHEMKLSRENRQELRELVGPKFYFSKAAYQYHKDSLPHKDPETAMGYQVVFDTLVRNWDGGDRNIWYVSGVPVWFDFGASLDPRCQNIYRFLLKLQDAAETGRVSSIKRYFENFSRHRDSILNRAISMFKRITLNEIRTIVGMAERNYAGFFAEYIAENLSKIDEDIDIIRGAFLPKELKSDRSLIFSSIPREAFGRQVK
ncbi:MAG: hypothetical protein GX784_07425, partial [Firmicutes bacterium]|nr:hypothetical protein [Candidatus Fermentithermobacillaceae bacterium]